MVKPSVKRTRKPKATLSAAPDVDPYEAYKERQAAISRQRSEAGREIGPPPSPVDAKLKADCSTNLQLFCEHYLPERFPLAWSDDHRKAIGKLATCILDGGRFAFAMPRGSGKTSLCEAAALWAILYGHRRFVVLIGATEAAAEEMLQSIKVELEVNDWLAGDFAEVCHPIRALEGIANRCKGQTVDGERTRIEWTQKEIVLPTIPGSKASGAILCVAGLTGRIRGIKRGSLRPDLAIPDDPQTDESAGSVTQNAYREKVLSGAVMGLAGPKKKIACCMPCTVISPGDMVDRILDRNAHPEWNGERTKLIYSFPTDETRWDEYARLRADGMRAGDAGKRATEYYRENREAMDAGALIAWPERFNPDELSAIQFAMNLRIDNPRSFQSEYQNDPLPEEDQSALISLDADTIQRKINNVPIGAIPRQCSRLTAGIDVQGGVLFWLVVAWDEHFGGSVVEYGTFPKQTRYHFRAADARPSLDDTFPGMVESARMYKGLITLFDWLLSRRWRQVETDAILTIERCLVDSGDFTDTVYQACRESTHTTILTPSKGYGLGAGKVPVDEWANRPGEKKGPHWRMRAPERGRGRLVMIDSNIWKSFVVERLSAPPATPGCLMLNGKETHTHQLLAEHLSSERGTITHGRGRTLTEWAMVPNRENHWWDCLCYAAVAASVAGIRLSASGVIVKAGPKKRLSIEELYQRAGK